MNRLLLISILFLTVLVIPGCEGITYERSLRIPVEKDTNFSAKIEIAKNVAQEVYIGLEERLLSKFPNVSKERINTLSISYGWEVQTLKKTVFVIIKISWKGEFNEVNAILEYCALEVTEALKKL